MLYKKNFRLPDDIWMVDLDSNKLTPARIEPEIPALPEPEGTILKNHLKQVKFHIRVIIFVASCSLLLLKNNKKCLNVIISTSQHSRYQF